MMLAPASKARLASRAISSGVTGTWCCFGSVSTPFSAQVMTALSLMNRLQSQGVDGSRPVMMRATSAGFLRPRAIRRVDATAAIDREIPRAGEDCARLQSIEVADRMAEMGRVGIADVLRKMCEVEVLIGEVQKVPSAFPGAKRAKGNVRLLLEQMKKARGRQARLGRAARRRHRLAAKPVDLSNRPDHARIEGTPRQGFAKAHAIELGAHDVIAPCPVEQV